MRLRIATAQTYPTSRSAYGAAPPGGGTDAVCAHRFAKRAEIRDCFKNQGEELVGLESDRLLVRQTPGGLS